MYCAKQRASVPFATCVPATLQVGRLIDEDSFACCASVLIAEGVMSEEPTIASCLRLSFTVLRALTPKTIATTPQAIRTTPQTTPPISRIRFVFIARPPVSSVLHDSMAPSVGVGRRCAIGRLPDALPERHPFACGELPRLVATLNRME